MTLVQPGPEMQISIRKELNENVDTRESDLQHIKEWLLKQPHLPDEWDDQRIMTYLRGCKFSREKCKRKLDMYFTMKAALPQLFNNRDITRPELKEIASVVNIPPLPGLTPNGRRVVCMRGLDKSIVTPSVYDAFKIVLMIGDVRLKEEETGVAGDVYIMDASVATSTHFAKFTPTIVKQFLTVIMEAYPVKLKEVHIVNVSPLVDIILQWVKPFLKDKIRNRIHVHSKLETLYEFIPREMLPSEYGGDAGSLQTLHDEWMKKLEEYIPWFKDQEQYKADEAKRPGKQLNYEDLFGMEGSFKQLTID